MEYDSDTYYYSAEESIPIRSQGEALIDATVSFNLRAVLKLLEAGIDPNEPLEDGITALHIAANSDRNRVYVMQALLDYEADPNIQSMEGETPLHVAASWGKLEAIKILLANNADPRVKNLSGKTPLDCCNEMKHKECSDYLREILKGRAIPRSVSQVFEELDFENFGVFDQTEELPDVTFQPKLAEKSKRKERGSLPTGLDSSDELFLTELNDVLRSESVVNREREEFPYTKQQVTKSANSRPKSTHTHQRSRSTPSVVSRGKAEKMNSRKLMDISHPGYSSLMGEDDQLNYTYTEDEITLAGKYRMNDTFEIPDLPIVEATDYESDVRPVSPLLANIDLADSDVTLTVFDSDDSEFYPTPAPRSRPVRSVPDAHLRQIQSPPRKTELRVVQQTDRVPDFVKAEELIARNARNRVNQYYANQINQPLINPVNERHEVVHSKQIDRSIEANRLPDKLSDNESPLLVTDQSKNPVSILKKKNENPLNFSMSQPYSYDKGNSKQLDTVGEGRNSPLNKEMDNEQFNNTVDYSREESYIQPPDLIKKPIKQKIGEIVSKGRNLNLKPKLSIHKPNFLKSNAKSSQSNTEETRELHLSYHNSKSTRTTTSSNSTHTSPSMNSTATQTVVQTAPTQKTTNSPKPTKAKKSNIPTSKPVTPDINALSARLDREYTYGTSGGSSINTPPPNIYPEVTESPNQINTPVSHKYSPIASQSQSHSTPPLNHKSDRTPDLPPPYTNKRSQNTTPTSPYPNTHGPYSTETPNSFSNPYLDTSHITHNPRSTHYATEPISKSTQYATEPTSKSTHYATESTISQSTHYATESTISQPTQYSTEHTSQSTYFATEPISQSTHYATEPISQSTQYTPPEPTPKPRSYVTDPVPQPTHQSRTYTLEAHTNSMHHDAQPISRSTQSKTEPISEPTQCYKEPILTAALPTRSPASFSDLLEEVNRSLPYELKLSDTPTTPRPPNPTSTSPSSIKLSGIPTPFIQTEADTPSTSSQAVTPRSKRRVTIDPNPTEVQYCDEYDRTPVMPSLDNHISSDDSDELRDGTIQKIASLPEVQRGGAYVAPPPYQCAPALASSETLDATFDLDSSVWRDSPTYIGLDEYLRQQSQEFSSPVSPPNPSLPDIHSLTDQQLREELINIGEQSGPITPVTRPLYIRYLAKVRQDPTLQSSNCFQGYLYELAQVLTGSFPIPNELDLETDMCHYFDNPPTKCTWREGITKESFNYILIDPRISQNLPSLIADLSELDRFRIFIESIFYVGKGKRSRPYSHLYEAISCERTGSPANHKQQRILDIWSSGHGVVSLHCFQGIIAVEAFTREACLLDAIGLHKLTNTKRGEYYGVVSEWGVSKKRRLGVFLLHRAMHILIAEGERQICRENLTK